MRVLCFYFQGLQNTQVIFGNILILCTWCRAQRNLQKALGEKHKLPLADSSSSGKQGVGQYPYVFDIL